jgi:hypothetical protein
MSIHTHRGGWLGIALGVILALLAVARAEVIEVPGEVETIQAAIGAATDGDTVLVAPGCYEENIDFRGKAILVASHYVLAQDSSYVRRTIIDGGHSQDPDTMSCVRFVSEEGPASVLQGFLLTGGTGTTWVDPQWPQYTWRGGGGIFCFRSSPTIANNLVCGNDVSNNGSYDGAQAGGILCYGGQPRICNNTVSANRADYGGGIVVDYSGALITNNIVAHNHGGVVYGGGAFWTIGQGPAPIVIENNTVIGNVSATNGGAFYIWNSAVTARNNILWDNEQAVGGPIRLAGSGSLALTYTDVEGGYTGEGNMSMEPQFADSVSFVLTPESPCVDSGDPEVVYNDPEDPAHPGLALWPAQGVLRNDMGVYGGPGCMAFEPGQAGVKGDRRTPADGDRGAVLLPCGLSPTRAEASFRFHLSQATPVSLRLYLPTGACVREIAMPQMSAGWHRITWDGCDSRGRPVPTGFYTACLAGAGLRAIGRVVLLR